MLTEMQCKLLEFKRGLIVGARWMGHSILEVVLEYIIMGALPTTVDRAVGGNDCDRQRQKEGVRVRECTVLTVLITNYNFIITIKTEPK
uniref:Uncharacterized protein n=1 Tax=Astyanax mexicanus TaxID=7994 RepID=A0A8B9LH01_ASTMX